MQRRHLEAEHERECAFRTSPCDFCKLEITSTEIEVRVLYRSLSILF